MMWLRITLLYAALALGPAAGGGGAAHGASSKARSGGLVPMTVHRVEIVGGVSVVLLQAHGGGVYLPVWIDGRQAQSIELRRAGLKAPRPLSHDLLEEVIKGLGARIERLEIIDLRAGIFIGRLVLRDAAGKRRAIDARPSDLMVLAVGNKVPVFVAAPVLLRAGQRGGATPALVPPVKI